MLILTREDVLKVFSMRDAIEADKKAFVLQHESLICGSDPQICWINSSRKA